MRLHLLVVAGILLASPAALAAPAMEAMHHHGPHGHVAHSHQQARVADLVGTFHFNAPAKAVYTCPMHPDVTSEKPGACTQCGMTMQKQTHHVALQLFDTHKKPVQGALVRLTIKDAHGMVQGLTLKGDGYYEGDFHLMPGKQLLTAYVKRPSDKQAVELKTTYQVK